MATIVTRAGKGAPLTIAEGDANFVNLENDKIELTDISVSTASVAETSALSYNNTTGLFTFTPVATGDLIGLTDLSITTGAASGAGALSYDNTTGVFTFNPVDVSLVLTELADDTAPALAGNLDVGTFNIETSTVNGNITIQPNGTGVVLLNSQVRINGNLDVQTHTITTSTVDGDVNISANGTGSVVLDGASIEVPQNITNPTGNIFLQPVSAGSVDVKADSMLIGESSSSTEALLTTAAGSNANLKIRAAGTGTIILDDATEINGNFDIKTNSITTSTTNGIVEILNNGTGSTLITGGAGLGISSGYIASTGTDANLTLSPNGDGAVVVNAPISGMVIENTASSGFGSITGNVSTGLALTTNGGANGVNDAALTLSNGGGASLGAGATSTLTLTGDNIDLTAETSVTLNGLTDIAELNNFIHGLTTEASVTGTYAPDATTGNVKYVIPSGNITINDFAAGSIVPGQSITMLIDQSSFGTSFTLTLGANFLNPGGTAPALTASGNDLISFLCLDDGTATGGNIYIANIVNDYQ